MINRAGSILPGFEAMNTIERGQASENVNPFTASIAAYCRNEIIFSDGNQGFGLQLGPNGYVWRMLNVGLTAIYYERQDDEIIAAFYGKTMLYEHFGAVVDQTQSPSTVYGLIFDMQTASQLLDEGQVAVLRRIFVDVNCQVEPGSPAQELGVIAITDNIETYLGSITNTGRATSELAFQYAARQFSLRLVGCLANRVEVFGVEMDCALTGSEVTQGASV